MAYLVVRSGPKGARFIELEGRPLREGDPLLVPRPLAPAEIVDGWSPATYVGVHWDGGRIRIAWPDGTQGFVGFEIGLRRREGVGHDAGA